MSSFIAPDLAIIGHACRLPGADSVDALWRLLRAGQSSVADAPTGRWPVERALHPRRTEPGFSYTFAGGYLDDPFAFDPGMFGISPREVQQIDPQQRLLLEVVWEALEDAGLPPSRTAGQEIGVYVGASNVDYQTGASGDPAAIESHFMTGNSLSIVSNRISYIYDWRGPSFTVDSACSSSFVALAQAAAALKAGMIDTAVVAGVNLLLSPAPFIGFSRASMLSPTGRCRPFSADADGYVRSEGAIALVLRRASDARASGQRAHAEIAAASVNSDGRTSGISLPSADGQSALMAATYGALGIRTDDLAFVEAHGTGTPVGDPIEAHAIGTVLGAGRSSPLPVGSVKSNIGHLECVSGLAGLLKSALALRHGVLPRTLYLDGLNPHIDFAALGLAPAREEMAVDAVRTPFAGICNYGFGGTNAHVVLRTPSPAPAATSEARVLSLSARSQEALRALSTAYAGRLRVGDAAPGTIAAAAWHQRDGLDLRLALPVTTAEDMARALEGFAAGETSDAALATGKAHLRPGKTVFVYSGNGAQWVGMGRTAMARNAAFRARFEAIDAIFAPLAGWSLAEALQAPDLPTRLERTSVAQPLMFAIQAALTSALAAEGVKPDLVLGHSVGEVAAALASGALDLTDAIHLIHHRSLRQESVAGQGRMVALAAGETQAEAFVDGLGDPSLTIAAINGPHSVTLSGSLEAMAKAEKAARLQRLATVALDIAYPFHSHLLDPAEAAIRDDLSGLAPQPTQATFISTVTGAALEGTALDAAYWWRNIRLPVRFADAIAAAAALGGTHFVEIGARPILVSAASDTLRAAGVTAECMGSLVERDDQSPGDPVRAVVARAVARGLVPDADIAFGAPPSPLDLPHYPWQRQRYVLPNTSEAIELYGRVYDAPATHPLLGLRVSQGVPEWRSWIDAEIVPYLADHKVGDEAVVPGAALAEMMLSVGRDVLGDIPLELTDFDILRPVALAEGSMREVSTRFDATTRTCEIWSRLRLGGGAFLLNATGRLAPAVGTPVRQPLPDPAVAWQVDADTVYGAARRCGLNYGPAFSRVSGVERDDDGGIARLEPRAVALGAFADLHTLDPTALDAGLHMLFLDAKSVEGETRTHLPVRIGVLRLWQPSVAVVETILRRRRENRFTAVVDITLLAADGSVVAEVADLVLREVVLARRDDDARRFRLDIEPARIAPATPPGADAAALAGDAAPGDAHLLLRGFVRSALHECAAALADAGEIDPARLAATGRIAPEAEARVAGLIELLTVASLASREGSAWRLSETRLPASAAIFRTLVDRFPSAMAEIRAAAHLAASLPEAFRRGTDTALPAALADLFEADAFAFRAPLGTLRRAVEERIAACAPVAPHVVVAAPTDALAQMLAPFARSGRAQVTLPGADAAACERLSLLPQAEAFAIANLADEDRALPAVDLVLALAIDDTAHDAIERIAPGAAGARVVVAHPPADAALALLLATGGPAAPTAAETEGLLERLGAGAIAQVPLGDGFSSAVAGSLAPAPETDRAPVWLVGEATPDFAAAFLAAEPGTRAVSEAELPPRGGAATLVLPMVFDPAQAPRPQVTAALLQLKDVIARVQDRPDLRLWIVTAGGRPQPGETLDPAAVALCAFCRVAMNENPGLDLRLVDVDAFDAAAAARVRRLVDHPGAETERVSRPDGEYVVRVRRGVEAARTPAGDDVRTRLVVAQQGALGSMDWVAEPRIAPGAGEIEIAVAATGLNFRDVMLALGALDDDILGPGLTGASLGFELAGTVTRVGEGVSGHEVGDRVMGFAPDAFASHVTVPGWYAFPVPDQVPPEAAASIPVAFATAWYALVECARLSSGESVLIHGAAGGVGLAAVAIALSRGARVIATAGTAEKAALLRGLGVDAVYNSRDLGFAGEIARSHGKVDVVLNSLAGEAMAASLKLVKPFGRFIELGKRDFLANTTVGLRPFARNLSYFGVDLDQLLAHDPARAKAMMGDIAAAFASGTLRPIPYRVMAGESVEEAFRQMQAARHVGKIVVRPAESGAARPAAASGPLAGEGLWLVVGGTGGFGLETALWLAGQTQGTVAVASRSGVRDPAAANRITAASAAGARIVVEAVDARDEAALAALVDRLVAEHGALRGIIHTAMVLEDGAIPSFTPEGLATVLAPKIDGVVALDRITQAHPVAHFVVFSSASAMIGSPGQGAYVAANGFLEGVVRNRRARGLPGLALAWGAISDAGVLAKDQALGQRLARATGVAGIASAEALAFLGRRMAEGMAADPVCVYAQVNQTSIASQLPVLQTPTFPRLFSTTGAGAAASGDDLMEQLAGRDDAEARDILRTLLAGEIGAILRLPADTVSGAAALSDLGMDSLMALELRLTLEKKFGIELPLLSIGSGRTLDDLAAVALSSLRGAESSAEPAAPRPGIVIPDAEAAMAAQHGVELGDAGIGTRVEAIAEARKAARAVP
ncbi:SDR family NAD(P)-dependent oxidoreductase [Xanthobacter sp. KR7-65]|uniref:SDR family NAD(P)-dependent oxidoreductase n=1 Tax=Xanthobacter sp. KR7-65 TaxID=3156612 RepID=UPI0032B4C332